MPVAENPENTANRNYTPQGGVACLGDPSCPPRRISPQDEIGHELHITTRFMHCCYPLQGSHDHLHVLIYYGISDSTRNPARRKLNEEQLQLVFDYGKSLGAVPVIISLDLNQDPSSCGPLCDAINSSFWTDLAIPKASSRDREPLATYVEQKWKRDECEVKSGQTRIDLMVVNEIAKLALKTFVKCMKSLLNHAQRVIHITSP